MSSSEEFDLLEIRTVLDRSIKAIWWPMSPEEYLRPLLRHDHVHYPAEEEYHIKTDYLDPLVPDLRDTFKSVIGWAFGGLGTIPDRILGLDTVIGSIVSWFRDILEGIIKEIRDGISGLANFICNIYDWVLWNLVDDLVNFVKNLFKPITDVWNTVISTLTAWFNEIYTAITGFLETPWLWISNALLDLWAWLKSIKDTIWDSLVWVADVIGGYIGTKLTEFAPMVVEYLRDALAWLWDTIKTGFLFVVEDVVPAAWASAAGALGWLKDEFTNLIGQAYTELMEKARTYVPMTPERSVELAGIMFGSAVGFGALAHGMALAVEAIPNLKYMGVHYMSAFTATMGGFGAISGATMGVIAALSLRVPFTYYMQSLLRPIMPRAADLMMMAVKPDIPIEIFRAQMAYEGYSDYWIDAFQRTMYREPRYFELAMMGEDEAATDEWLYTKARRAGYIEEDSKIFVSSLVKKVTRTQRIDFYRQAFYAFREGYISEAQFGEHLDALEFRPEAKTFVVKAAELAYQTDFYKEVIKTHLTAFRQDLTTETECRVALTALGMRAERVNSIVELEVVKKQPKILKAEQREIEKELREIQSKDIRLHIESFRRGLITEETLEANLIAIGMVEGAARATARYEAIKLLPKPIPVTPSLEEIQVWGMTREEADSLEEERKRKEREWRDIQDKYSRLYIEGFRRGLITEGELVDKLRAIGVEENVARATATYERVKKVPKVKPAEITIPVIPIPPSPPEIE